MRIPVLVAALAVAASAGAADRTCGKSDASAAGRAIDRIVTWDQMHQAWRGYAHCDSGAIAAAYTDALARLVIDWKDVNALAAAMSAEPGYHDFVLAHLKAIPSKDDRDDVYSRAKESCPAGLAAFCAEVGAAVKGAPSAAGASGTPDTLDLSPLQIVPESKPPAKPGADKPH
ncbi:MAG TPA: hypothetical protein VEG27_14310 [Usitatibacter sp.]|nr:hypothetical protein [Usitatibacter sp.]